MRKIVGGMAILLAMAAGSGAWWAWQQHQQMLALEDKLRQLSADVGEASNIASSVQADLASLYPVIQTAAAHASTAPHRRIDDSRIDDLEVRIEDLERSVKSDVGLEPFPVDPFVTADIVSLRQDLESLEFKVRALCDSLTDTYGSPC